MDFFDSVELPKKYVIINRRLGMTFWGLQISLIVGALCYYLGDTSWATEYVPVEGFASFWADPSATTFKSAAEKDESSTICTSPMDYEYHWSETFTYQPVACIDMPVSVSWEKGESTIVIPTYFKDTITEREAGSEGCAALKLRCESSEIVAGATYSDLSEMNLRGEWLCECSGGKAYFIKGASGMKVDVNPMYIARMPTRGGQEKTRAGSPIKEKDDIWVLIGSRRRNVKPDLKKMSKKKPLQNQDALAQTQDAPSRHTHHGEQSSKARMQRAEGKNVHFGLLRTEQTQENRPFGPDEAVATDSVRNGSAVAALEFSAADAHDTNSPTEGEKVKDIFEPGETIGMSVENWLRQADLLSSSTGSLAPFLNLSSPTHSLLDAANVDVRKNVKDVGNEYPSFRMTGIELTFDMSFRNAITHKENHEGEVLEINVHARGGWHSRPAKFQLIPVDPVTGKSKTVERYFYGIIIRFNTGGTFGLVNWFKVISVVATVIVFFKIPLEIVKFIAFYMLGNYSDVYFDGAQDTLDVKTQFNGLSAKMVGWHSAFQQAGSGPAFAAVSPPAMSPTTGEPIATTSPPATAPATDGPTASASSDKERSTASGDWTREELIKTLKAVAEDVIEEGEDSSMNEQNVEAMATKAVNEIIADNAKDGDVITASEMTRCALSIEPVPFEKLVGLYDPRMEEGIITKVFKFLFLREADRVQNRRAKAPNQSANLARQEQARKSARTHGQARAS